MNESAPFSSDPLLHRTVVIHCSNCHEEQRVRQSRPKSAETALWSPDVSDLRGADGQRWQDHGGGVLLCSQACGEAYVAAPAPEHEIVTVGDETVHAEHVEVAS